MKVTLSAPGPDGLRRLTFGLTTRICTQHDLNDLEAALAQDKAKSRHCGDEEAEHTCVMPPGHWILPHVCRACRHQWVTPALRARGDARARGGQP